MWCSSEPSLHRRAIDTRGPESLTCSFDWQENGHLRSPLCPVPHYDRAIVSFHESFANRKTKARPFGTFR